MESKRHIAIFTTASLPWMTGTAVNPLFRAAYLTKDGDRKVSLVIPWLSVKDQELVYPNNITFSSPMQHETYVRRWLEERTQFISGFNICFYPAKFSRDKRSILAVGDITKVIPDEEADIAVLEEPEHLTWYHHGKRWKTKFRLVIGIVHTNYLEYVKREKNGMQAFLLKYINSWVIQIYCHKVIRLSAATQDLPRSIICNVHVVNPKFLDIGKRMGSQILIEMWFLGKCQVIRLSAATQDLPRSIICNVHVVNPKFLDIGKRMGSQILIDKASMKETIFILPVFCSLTITHSEMWFLGKCQVIRLSAATQDLPRSIICNVHGVNPKFLDIGKRKQGQQQEGIEAFSKGAYYIGKMVWSKGYRELLPLLSDNKNELSGLQVDLYGNGEDSDQVKEAAKKLGMAVNVHPGRDHADPLFHDYKVFLNPSTTDVVCTTTAEALAMGKVVVCANHPSNEFFKQFPNCHTYDDGSGFVKMVRKALDEEPVPLTDSQRHKLSWEAATERFLKAVGLDKPTKQSDIQKWNFMSTTLRLPDFRKNMEDASAFFHFAALGFEPTRKAFGAIPGSLQPDEEQCRELGLPYPAGKHDSKYRADGS
ncbi:hypothetical protein Scep_025984 [Stephania cephalantha]|uniref:Digalactosyldiacylglycerol synthase 2, chloroplastic n=1 Tax=Stephania cephalantha TaxID=152367 RepID=A0AAP0HSY0_9MAGN